MSRFDSHPLLVTLTFIFNIYDFTFSFFLTFISYLVDSLYPVIVFKIVYTLFLMSFAAISSMFSLYISLSLTDS